MALGQDLGFGVLEPKLGFDVLSLKMEVLQNPRPNASGCS